MTPRPLFAYPESGHNSVTAPAWTPRLTERWNWLTTWADTRGIEIELVNLPDKVYGYWLPDHRVIQLDGRLTPRQRVSTLAHECAHAALGHTVDGDLQERSADEMAARLLIDPFDLAAAKKRLAGDPQLVARVAEDLEVCTWIVESIVTGVLLSSEVLEVRRSPRRADGCGEDVLL